MGLTVADSYYLKARAHADNMFGDWNEVCESLNYALSYNDTHCGALCFLGEIYVEHLSLPEKGYAYFDKVIAIDPYYEDVYYKYIKYLLWYGHTERAAKLILFALQLPSIDKAYTLYLASYTEEVLMHYDRSLRYLREAEKHTYNNYFIDFLRGQYKRIEKKSKGSEVSKSPEKKKKKSKKKNT